MIRLLKKIVRSLRHRKMMHMIDYVNLPSTRYVGGTVKTSIGNLSYVDAPTLLAGIEELFGQEIYKVMNLGSSKPIVLDCGANIGLSALYFANTYNARVFAFEADPNIFSVLTRNAEARTSGEIQVVNKAIWVHNDGVTFDLEGGYSGQIHQHGSELVKASVQVPSFRLRDLIMQYEKVDFLKLDIEGAENTVIPDCEEVLNRIHYIFIEYHSNALDPQALGDLLNTLSRQGFRYHIKEAFTSSHPFYQIDEVGGMDLQLNVYATNGKFEVARNQ